MTPPGLMLQLSVEIQLNRIEDKKQPPPPPPPSLSLLLVKLAVMVISLVTLVSVRGLAVPL
jgi:hypothetical protein